MKKLFSIVLAMLLTVEASLVLKAKDVASLQSLPVLGVELIKNGDFASTPDPSSDWVAFRGEWENNAYTSYVKDPLNQNGYCVKVTDMLSADTGAVSNPYAKQEVAVVPGAKYVLTGKIYSEKPASGANASLGSALIKLEFFNQNGGESKLGSYKGTNGEWVSFSHTIEIPSGSSGMRILLRQQGLGHMYFDDISLKMTEAPSGIHLQTDEVFYYSDHKEAGIATATINTAAYPELSGKSVDFYLKKGSNVLSQAKSVPTVNNSATFQFDVGLLSVLQDEYYIEANVSGYSDAICKNTWKIYRYNRPRCLDANGVYRRVLGAKAGEVVQPVFAYRYRDYQFEIGKKNGIVVAQLAMPQNKDGSYYSDEDTITYLKNALDNAAASGVMCMIALYRNAKPAGNEVNRAVTEKVVKALSTHEALFAWMVMDETFTHFANPQEDLRVSYITIRNNDPYHPVYLCEATARLEEAGRYADILTVDPYPASYLKNYDNNAASPFSAAAVFPGERVALAVDAVKGRKPVYSLLQAFRWQDSYPDYFPSGNEMRNMLYQSLIAGAAGVGYFKFDKADGNVDLNNTALWPYISDFATVEQKDAFDAFVYDKYPIFGDIRAKNFWATSFIKEGIIHLVVLNRYKTAQTITVPLLSADGKTKIKGFSVTCVDGGTVESAFGTSSLSVTVPAAGAALYKIKPIEIYNSDFVIYEHFADGMENWKSVDNYTSGMKSVSEENGNTYLRIVGKDSASINRGEICTDVLPEDVKRYRFSFKAKPLSAGSVPRMDILGMKTDGSGEVEIIKNAPMMSLGDSPSDGWIEYVYYCSVAGKEITRLRLRFYAQAGMQMGYDDIILEPAKTNVILHTENGEVLSFTENDNIFVRMYNAEEKDMRFVVARYTKVENGAKSLDGINVLTVRPNAETVFSLFVPNSSGEQEITVYACPQNRDRVFYPFQKIFFSR